MAGPLNLPAKTEPLIAFNSVPEFSSFGRIRQRTIRL